MLTTAKLADLEVRRLLLEVNLHVASLVAVKTGDIVGRDVVFKGVVGEIGFDVLRVRPGVLWFDRAVCGDVLAARSTVSVCVVVMP